jgi:hypothetical protein
MTTAATKAEKERMKLVQDKCIQFLTELLKDDDNKYCVDCDAKGQYPAILCKVQVL